MNLKELKEVFRLVEKSDFREVEISQGELRVRIERGPASPTPPVVHLPVSPISHVAATSPSTAAPTPEPKPTIAKSPDTGKFVTSPFVGTFYRSPSPDSPTYVEVGQTVKKGQALCIVEAMKLMNEIESDYDGRIAEIYVENGKAVEFGEKLFRIEVV